MQQDAVEVSFCDLCGTSVPDVDLTAGTALRHQGKTIGACCLPTLRGAAAPTPLAAAAVVRGERGESRILPVAIVMLAAIAAATLFLDHRITATDTLQKSDLVKLSESQTSDSQVLQGLAVAMDAVPRRPEVDALAARLTELSTAAEADRKTRQETLDRLGADLSALAAQQRAQADKVVDYRPLFEDLRQRQLKLIDLMTTMRAVAPVGEPIAPAAATPETPGAPAPAAGDAAATVPPALAEAVKKLSAAEAAVRFEAVDELLRSKDQSVLPQLLPLAKDADSFVRRLTVEGLASFKRPEAVEALLVALGDAVAPVRETAWRSLKELTGQKIPFEPDGSKDARARAVQKWQEWWEKNRATFGA